MFRRLHLLIFLSFLIAGDAWAWPDPSGLCEGDWVNMIENLGPRLGGGNEGAWAVRLRDGGRGVLTFRQYDPSSHFGLVRNLALKTAETAQDLARLGDFANVLGTYEPPASASGMGRIWILMEDMRRLPDGTVAALSGDLRTLLLLQNHPLEQRIQVRNRAINLLLRHPDRHMLNIRWRSQGVDDPVDVRMIDPFPNEVPIERQLAILDTDPTSRTMHNPWQQIASIDDQLKLPAQYRVSPLQAERAMLYTPFVPGAVQPFATIEEAPGLPTGAGVASALGAGAIAWTILGVGDEGGLAARIDESVFGHLQIPESDKLSISEGFHDAIFNNFGRARSLLGDLREREEAAQAERRAQYEWANPPSTNGGWGIQRFIARCMWNLGL